MAHVAFLRTFFFLMWIECYYHIWMSYFFMQGNSLCWVSTSNTKGQVCCSSWCKFSCYLHLIFFFSFERWMTWINALIFQCFWAMGACFEVLLALFIMPTLGWRWLLAISAIPVFISAFICCVRMILIYSLIFFHWECCWLMKGILK